MIGKTLVLNRIDGIIRFFLYLLIALLPFSKAAVEICVSIAIVLWVIKRLLIFSLKPKTQKLNPKTILQIFKPQDSMLNRPIALFIFFAIISVIGSVYFKISLRAFFSKFMEGLLLFFIIIEAIREKRQVSIIIGLLLCATVVVSVDGIIQRFFTGFDVFRQMPITRGGITAAFNHKNDLGGYLLIPLPIVAILMMKKIYIAGRWQVTGSKSMLVILFVLLGLFTFTMALTNSRGAWAALILGISMTYFSINKKIFKGIVISGCLVLAMFLLFIIYSPEEHQSEVFDIQHDIISRAVTWKDALSMIKDRPIFGHGINTYMRVMTKMHAHFGTGPTYAHNCYLQIAAEMGITGLASFLWIIGRLFHRCILEVRKQKSEARLLLIGLLCGLLAFLVHSFVDTNLHSLQLNALFWYMVGLTICVYRQLGRVEYERKHNTSH